MESMMLSDICKRLGIGPPPKDFDVWPQDFYFRPGVVHAVLRRSGGLNFSIPCDNPKRLHTKIMRLFPAVDPEIKFGKGCIVHQTAVIGKGGFGYTYNDNGAPEHRRHFGGVAIGDRVAVGAHTCIDRGMLSDTTIGDDTKIDNLVHIAHNCQIGKRCMVVAGAVICGSAVIGDDCWIGAGARIIQKITIGNGAVIGIGAVVIRDVAPGAVMVGNPARDTGTVKSGRGSKL